MAFFFFKNRQKKLNRKEKAGGNRIKLGLALGGGGARGYAHLGALKALEEEGIEFDMVSGTSVGALVGALYSSGISADDLIRTAENIRLSDLKRRTILPGSHDPAKVGWLFRTIAGDISFEELNKPFYAVAVDIISAREVVLASGSVAQAVSASCAVPGFFTPYALGGCHYVDGGLLNNIPSDVLKVRGADHVVAIDINSTRGQGTTSLKLLDVLSAGMRISLANASTKGLLAADVVIRPDTKRFSSKSKEGYKEMIAEGYTATKSALPSILTLINPNP